MNVDIKTFNDSSESGLAIQKVTARAKTGMKHGASLELFYPAENKEAIILTLSNAGVQVHSTGKLSLTIKAEGLYQCERIKNALDTLKAANLISDTFVRQISGSFPNGMGGINPLSGSATYKNIMDRLDLSSNVETRRLIMTNSHYIRDTPQSSHHDSHVEVHSGLSSAAPTASDSESTTTINDSESSAPSFKK